jgi:hypothetical protein
MARVENPAITPFLLAYAPELPHPGGMRAIFLLKLMAVACQAQDAFGTWKMNPARSTFSADSHAREITLRIERHNKGEVVTFDRVFGNGQGRTTSLILYLDGESREFHGDACSGTQSSHRLDARTVEVQLHCRGRRTVRMIRRVPTEPRDLILEISEQTPDGRHTQNRLVLEKQ